MNQEFKIYRYVDPDFLPLCLRVHPGWLIFPEGLNKNLPKKHFIALGERVKTIFFDRYEDGRFIDPIIKIDYKFNRDEFGYLVEREKTVSWQLENNSWATRTQLDIIPVSSNQEKISELKKRRQNIVDEVAGLSKKIGLGTALTDLYKRYFKEIELYTQSGLDDFAIALNKNTDLPWLERPTSNPNISVRDFLINYFSIGLEVETPANN